MPSGPVKTEAFQVLLDFFVAKLLLHPASQFPKHFILRKISCCHATPNALKPFSPWPRFLPCLSGIQLNTLLEFYLRHLQTNGLKSSDLNIQIFCLCIFFSDRHCWLKKYLNIMFNLKLQHLLDLECAEDTESICHI